MGKRKSELTAEEDAIAKARRAEHRARQKAERESAPSSSQPQPQPHPLSPPVAAVAAMTIALANTHLEEKKKKPSGTERVKAQRLRIREEFLGRKTAQEVAEEGMALREAPAWFTAEEEAALEKEWEGELAAKEEKRKAKEGDAMHLGE